LPYSRKYNLSQTLRRVGTLVACLCLAIALFVTNSHAPAGGVPNGLPLADYQWPTDAGRIVTSTFGEFRTTHFHAGIDISTGDVTGYRVIASRPGYVARIIVSPNGYGKRLILQHPDGYRTVYAHLRGFVPAIETLVRSTQDSLKRYPISITCNPTDFPVSGGDLIAFTGETGVGTPHLHFEIYDAQGNPVNPLLCSAFGTVDRIAPDVGRIVIIPLDPTSSVEGSPAPYILNTNRTMPLIRITGRAGIAVEARDRTEGSRFRRSVYRHTLLIDARPFFSTSMDHLSGEYPQEVGIHYDWPLYYDRGGRFERLFVSDSILLPTTSFAGTEAGTIDTTSLSQGTHAFQIISEDINGNKSAISGHFSLFPPLVYSTVFREETVVVAAAARGVLGNILLASRQAGQSSWSPLHAVCLAQDDHQATFLLRQPLPDAVRVTVENPSGLAHPPSYLWRRHPVSPATLHMQCELEPDWVRVEATTDGVFTSSVKLVCFEGSARREFVMESSGTGEAVCRFRPDPSYAGMRRLVAQGEVNGTITQANDEMPLYPIVPGRHGAFSFSGGKLVIEYDSASVFSPLFLRVEESAAEERYNLGPASTVLRDGITAVVHSPATSPHRGLFLRRRGSWMFLAREDPPGIFSGHVSGYLCELGILSDNVSPRVSHLSIANLQSRRPVITFRFQDDLAGVDYNEMRTYIDDMFVIPEVDGEHRRGSFQPAEPLSPGTHHVAIVLTDRLGNSSTENHRFVVR
jgi:hypothetical protein